jgi:hypothetical protein
LFYIYFLSFVKGSAIDKFLQLIFIHFVSIVDEHQIDTSSITESISKLFKHLEPVKHKDGSARDKVFHKYWNPLLYLQKLIKYGFRVMGDYEYYSIHYLPPILLESNNVLPNYRTSRVIILK